jgi:hypothetical protein
LKTEDLKIETSQAQSDSKNFLDFFSLYRLLNAEVQLLQLHFHHNTHITSQQTPKSIPTSSSKAILVRSLFFSVLISVIPANHDDEAIHKLHADERGEKLIGSRTYRMGSSLPGELSFRFDSST